MSSASARMSAREPDQEATRRTRRWSKELCRESGTYPVVTVLDVGARRRAMFASAFSHARLAAAGSSDSGRRSRIAAWLGDPRPGRSASDVASRPFSAPPAPQMVAPPLVVRRFACHKCRRAPAPAVRQWRCRNRPHPPPPRRGGSRSTESGRWSSASSRGRQTRRQLPAVPPGVRERVKGRISGVRREDQRANQRRKALDLDKLDRLGPARERMRDGIEKAMEGIDKAGGSGAVGRQLGKELRKEFGKDSPRAGAQARRRRRAAER